MFLASNSLHNHGGQKYVFCWPKDWFSQGIVCLFGIESAWVWVDKNTFDIFDLHFPKLTAVNCYTLELRVYCLWILHKEKKSWVKIARAKYQKNTCELTYVSMYPIKCNIIFRCRAEVPASSRKDCSSFFVLCIRFSGRLEL